MRRNLSRYLFVCCLTGILSLPSALGQTVTGSITGVVTDPSGAVVVGATVTAQNTETGVATTAQTNGAGVYTIHFLPIGSYTLTVDAKGFTSEKLAPFSLEINQTAKIDVGLKIGTSETAVVTATAHPILDTTDATLSTTLTPTEIQNIPLNGRNFSSLTLFQPGAVNTDPTGLTGNNAIERDTFNNGVVAINGNRQQANNYTLEGADDNEPQNNLIAYNPAPDAIAELRVVAANANATYGNANGGAVVTILKSGTNNYHGSLYELLESQILDANTWANNDRLPVIPKNSYTQNIFGATFGGPIVKNKLFFFADYEGVRRHTGGSTSASLLTPDMLKGNFSALTAQGIQLYDTQNNFTPYTNNQVPVVNPVALYLAAHPELYPAPNAIPTDHLINNNFQGPQSSFVSNNQEDFKVDWTPGNANRVNGFYSQGTGSDFTSALIPVSFPAHNTYPTKIAGASFVHTFSPTIINELRFGFSRVRWNNGIPSDPSGLFGLTGDQKVGIPFGTQKFVGFTGQSINNNASYIGTSANPQFFTDNTFNYYDNLTWQHGRHFLSIGGQATRYQQNYLNAGNVGFLGEFDYSGQFTALPKGNGYGPADFVLGEITGVKLASPLGLVGNRQWRLAGYIQDDFKFTPRLTLNLGIRYEYDQPWYEQNDKTANVLPNNTVEYAGRIPSGAAPGSVLCPTRACYNGNYDQIMPRVGFAYQAMDKLVIRGGYGGTSFFEGYSFNQRLTSSPPFSLAINSSATIPSAGSGGSPFSVANAFSQPLGINNSLYSVWPQNVQPAYIHQFTLMTEYALTNELSLSAGYHGQIGHHLADYRNGNQLTAAQAPGVAAVNGGAGNGCDNSLSYPAALRPPYYALVGECGSVLITESQARMSYNSGQVTLRQRTHHGFEYTLNYTYAKSLTDSSGNYSVANTSFNGLSVQNGYDPNADYGPSAMDVRHSLNFVGVYDIPFGRGKEYGSNANGVVDAVLGGWKVATSAILYTGLPVTIFGPNNSNTNNGGWGFSRANQYRPMIIRGQSLDDWWGTDPSAQPCVPNLVNPTGADNGMCAYGVANQFAFGTAHNSTQRAPGYRQVDMSLFKDFHTWHEQVVGFRADFFNIFNIASYGNPDNSISDSSFGQITSVRSPARQIQLSLHYIF
ncbi:MAG TPA: carboxypeptidase regulatory-like domain-containing protein [Terriglobales bacterium]|nr:carboxypeptidase regulatory-like domain-containing protein [Terriglobales bacterium]